MIPVNFSLVPMKFFVSLAAEHDGNSTGFGKGALFTGWAHLVHYCAGAGVYAARDDGTISGG
jgi:hypothetical protein